jgi:hypothetical protein
MPDYTSPYKIPGNDFNLNNGDIKLRQPKNLHIRLKEEKQPWSPSQGLTDFAGGLTAVTGGLSLLGDINKMNQGLKQQRAYFQDAFNTNNVTPEEKMGTWKYNNSTAQFTDFPNQKVIPFETGAANGINANTIMYPGNNMAKYGGSLFLTMAEGGQAPAPQPGMLPKLELGAMSPVQRTLAADNQHYGIPMAKAGGFFTPDKLSAGAENDEYYNKPQDDMMVAKKLAQEYIYKKGTTGESIPDINAPQMAMGGNPFESFGSARDTFGGSGKQFGQYDNPLTQYYAGLYDPAKHDALVDQFPDAMSRMYNSIASPIAANARAKDQALVEKFQNLDNSDNLEQQKYGGMKRYQTKGAIAAPTATDAAGFENWYNTTLGNMIGTSTPTEINQFISQAKQWAYDNKIDPNQLGQTNLNTNTVQGSMDAGYEADLDKTIADFENKYSLAVAQGASKTELDAILAQQDAAVKGVVGGVSIDAAGNQMGRSGKYNPIVSKVAPDYFGMQNAAQPGSTPSITPGTTPGAAGQGQQGSRYSPYVNDVLQAMANGYTRLGPLAFRSRRNLRDLLDHEAYAQNALYEDRNGMPGQGGNGTLNSAGFQGGWQGGVNMNPGVVPGGGSFDSKNDDTYSTWMNDNNIKRYRSDADAARGRYTLDVKRYRPGSTSFSRDGEDDGQNMIQRLFSRKQDFEGVGPGPSFGDIPSIAGPNGSPREGMGDMTPMTGLPGRFQFPLPAAQSPNPNINIGPKSNVPPSSVSPSIIPSRVPQSQDMNDPNYSDVTGDNRGGRRGNVVQPNRAAIEARLAEQQRLQDEADMRREPGMGKGKKAYGGQYGQGGSYGNNDLYKEGGTYYLSGGQIAKLRALGYDVQEH